MTPRRARVRANSRSSPEKYTAGKVKVEVYPNSQLYKDKEEIEALQLGAVQMLAPSTAKFAPLGAKEFEALDLPFVFKDTATYVKTVNGDVGKWLMSKLEPKGVKGLAFWDNGFHMVSANKPLIKPEDFQGLKIRISGLEGGGSVFPADGHDPANHGLLRGLSGAADRRRRCAARTLPRTTRRRSSTRCRSTSRSPSTRTFATR